MVLGEVFVEELRGHDLEDSVPQKLEPLVRSQGEVVETHVPVGEGPRQEPDVGEFDPRALLNFGQFLNGTKFIVKNNVGTKTLACHFRLKMFCYN